MKIQTVHEGRRGCGYRKPGGLYLRADGRGRPCGLLPIPLTVCPCCSAGIKFTRGWTWVDVAKLAAMKTEGCTGVIPKQLPGGGDYLACGNCPMAGAQISRAGLLWIGEQFYATPEEWMREADSMGISRRIHTLPKGFVIGETWVAVSHRKTIPGSALLRTEPSPGIFRLFQPTAVEYVVTGEEKKPELEALVKRGITPIRVVPIEEQEEFTDSEGDE